MSNLDTKERILFTSIELFNAYGIPNVSMRMIAHNCTLSPGNLNYHFKNKTDLLTACMELVNQEYENIPFLDELVFEGGVGLDHARKGFEFVEKYRFVFLDIMELDRAGETVQALLKAYSQRSLKLIHTAILLGVGKGTFKPEPFEGYFESLTENIYATMNLWLIHQRLLQVQPRSIDEGLLAVARILFPNYTPKGLEAVQSRIQALEAKISDLPIENSPN